MTEWERLKKRGAGYYKTGPDRVEPIDLYKSGGMLRDFAIGCIIKYAFRNRTSTNRPINPDDLEKIKHYADMLLVIANEE